ncbi:hypothetical protein SPRG_14884 [Saprolegnia parasitica CBS 223.65]|uniref:Uncharacterized protein n=1 Tax=Saprolegnia parasitica (strain CBS 223.65) TaxID=695850 RepID=A0A067BMY7_SAPPC|nr:hypothetical protein SPRG_14884 [Saprolegnia parasitica CBS 223.65]KDO19854.1 hypothetical protein SPRG_14884 [Saprolegnia parasitica CBS 223.65]|eukprot:XP_012209413.1 hypothetical protein SPRG_14884 [Saprolegnia parasitica CBS 223.65]
MDTRVLAKEAALGKMQATLGKMQTPDEEMSAKTPAKQALHMTICNMDLVDEALPEVEQDSEDNEPGLALLFKWNDIDMPAFLDAVNAPASSGNLAPPFWMKTLPPNVSFTSFTNDLFEQLKPNAADDRVAPGWIAPNTIKEYGAILAALREVEADPFIQAAMAAVPLDNCLAETYHVTLSHHIHPNDRHAPPTPLRRVFL